MSSSSSNSGKQLSSHDDSPMGEAFIKHDDWFVLVVGQNEQMHSTLRAALSDVTFNDHTLQLQQANSVQQAVSVVRQMRSQIALVLLDVSIEAGKSQELVEVIRNELAISQTRIILYSGQADYVVDENFIKQYDISEFKTATELTRNNLVTSVIAALRTYQQMVKLDQNRQGLEKLLRSSTHLLDENAIKDFSRGAIKQIAAFIGVEAEDILVAVVGSVLDEDNDGVYLLGAAGQFAPFINQKIETIPQSEVVRLMHLCLSNRENIHQQHYSVLYMKSADYEAAVYINSDTKIGLMGERILHEFISGICASYANLESFYHLRSAAYTDSLTRLPNRNEFVNLLEQAAKGATQSAVVALLDINNFADVNDGLGQDAGNSLLLSIARRLDEDFSGFANLGRIGADVFGVVGKESVVNPTSLEASFKTPFDAGEHVLPIAVSMGFYKLEDEAETGNEILKKTTIALNQAKRSPKGNCAYYQPEMEENTAQRLVMIRRLREDFAENKLQLWYQPQINLSSEKVIGMEALLRWPDGEGGYISPEIFVPLAEDSGLIIDIGAWVLEESCKTLQFLHLAGMQALRIAVNISMHQFREAGFVSSVKNAVLNHDIPPANLELEITESVVMDEPQAVIDTLNQLKQFGVEIAIDDFGTGFSSMSYLQKLPFDRLKVDRSFINQVSEGKSAHIAETIINLGNRLGLHTISEGIETPEQAKFVLGLGCEEAQGYLYGKPMPFDELLAFLNL